MRTHPKSRAFSWDNRAITNRNSSCHQGGDDSRLPNSAYRVDRDRAGNDFEPDPEPDLPLKS